MSDFDERRFATGDGQPAPVLHLGSPVIQLERAKLQRLEDTIEGTMRFQITQAIRAVSFDGVFALLTFPVHDEPLPLPTCAAAGCRRRVLARGARCVWHEPPRIADPDASLRERWVGP